MSRPKKEFTVTGQTGVTVTEAPLVDGVEWRAAEHKNYLGFRNLPVCDIEPSPTNPRKAFHADALAELARSITEHGVIQPIVVRRMLKANMLDLDHYQIVAGERRWRAAQLAGLELIPAVVQDLNDDQVLEVQVIENAQREDVHPLEECDGFNLILQRGIYDAAGLAEKLGKSVDYVRGRLNMTRLIPEAREEFQTGFIGIGHVRLLVAMPPDLQRDAVKFLTVDNWEKARLSQAPNAGALRSWLERNATQPLEDACWDLDDAALLPKAGACSICPKRTGPGTLFPDDKANCLDRKCFFAKRDALVKLRMTEAGATRMVTESYGASKVANEVPRWELGDGCSTEPGVGRIPLVLKDTMRLKYGEPILPAGTVVYASAKDLDSKADKEAARKAGEAEKAAAFKSARAYRIALATALCNTTDFALPPTAELIVAELSRFLNKEKRDLVTAVAGLTEKAKHNEELAEIYRLAVGDVQLRIFTALTVMPIVAIDSYQFDQRPGHAAESLKLLEQISKDAGVNLRAVATSFDPAGKAEPKPKKKVKN